MAQEIKIPVSANTAGAERAADELSDAFHGVADAVQSIAGASQSANRGLGDLLRRARETKQMLSRELGQKVSAGDTTTFMRNFAGMQPRSNSLRGFRTEQDWYRGHSALFKDASAAELHRRRVFAYGMQGTSFAGGGMPGSGGGGSGGGSGGWDEERSAFRGGVNKTASMAMGFGKSMLALAGISSILGMAGRARDLSTEEVTGIDSLKRRMGDVGINFDALRDQTRGAGVGLGVSYVESMRLGSAYTREAGNARGDLTGRLRNAYGFSRAYGLDPSEGTQFFGQMARFGGGKDESAQRRLALMIGDAVAKSGYTAKVDDLLQAVSDYTSATARITLSSPNVGGYANALTSLASRGLPGLDPASAAAMLGTADASMRRGGAMGDASLNFMYAAMRNASPGIKPVDALALMEGGLFGTTRGTFGPGSPLAGMMGKGVGLSDVTNFDKVVPMFRQFYGNNGYMLDAVKNTFGLSSHAQAAALVGLRDKGLLGGSMSLLQSAGIDPMAMNASGFATIGTLANTHGMGNLGALAGSIGGRSDLTPAARQKFAETVAQAMRSGNEETVRTAMAQAVAGLYQEKTPGSETRQAVTDLTDKMTTIGGALLQVLNPIREAALAIAERFVPGYVDSSGGRAGSAPWAGGNQGVGKAGGGQRTAIEKAMMQYYMAGGRTQAQAAAIVGAGIEESNLYSHALGDYKNGRPTAFGMFQMHADRWKPFVAWARSNGLDPWSTSAQMKYFEVEVRSRETPAGGMLNRAGNNPLLAAAAMVDYERPGGYNASYKNYQQANDWRGRLAQTQRLAAAQAPTAATTAGGAPNKVEGHVDVNITHPDGKKQTTRVPLKPVTAPMAAGAAPRVAGHISFGSGQTPEGS